MLNVWIFRKNHKSLFTKKFGRNAAFVVGLIISCIGEMALIGYAIQMPQLYYKTAIGDGLDFILAVLFLSVGNIILLLDNLWKNPQTHYFCKSIEL